MKGFRHFTAACALVLGLAVSTTPAAAQGSQPVELNGDVKVERTVTEDGKERRVLSKPDTVVPGDKLVFTTSYRNTGTDTVKDFVVTNPIPEAIRLTPQEAEALEISVDGGSSWGKLATLTVSDGNGGKRPAGVDDVTHIRWSFASLAPGAAGSVTYTGNVR